MTEPTLPVSQPSGITFLADRHLPNRLIHYFDENGIEDNQHAELTSDLLEAFAAERDRELQQAREEIARLKEALTKYGVHKWNCKKQDSPRPYKVNCTCGFSEALHPVPEKPQS